MTCSRPMSRMLVAAAALALPLAAQAQSAQGWQFSGTLYGWFPSIGGKTTFPQPTDGTSVTVDADKVLEDLKFVFMGALEARKGRWGGFTDVIYMDLGNSKSGTRDFSLGGQQIPADVQANVSYDLKGWAWTLAGTYVAIESPEHVMQVMGGARMLKLDPKVTWELTGNIGDIPAPGRAGSLESSDTYWDAIVGVKGRVKLGAERKWFIPYYVDIGTGESDLTWQAMGGLGYSFGKWDLFAAWRYLDYDFKSSSKVEDMNFNGPAVALQFHW
ncbi:MAG: hypothetical protein IT519_09880 [Burkholderiales bacterium]|nr:hypothetical protein [Burkholderiales bacterium]